MYPADKRKEFYVVNQVFTKTSVAEDLHSNGFGQPFGALCCFGETTIAAGSGESRTAKSDIQLIILPLVGSVNFSSPAFQNIIQVEEIGMFSIRKGNAYTLSNEYLDSNIHYLSAELKTSRGVHMVSTFSLLKNKLFSFLSRDDPGHHLQLSIGKYGGRYQSDYRCSKSKVFVYVLEGVFEIQDCLLEKSDGLAISTAGTITFESLSKDAMLLVLEFE